MEVGVDRGFLVGREIWNARAEEEFGIHSGGAADDRDWNWRECGGVQRGGRRDVAAASLPELAGVGGAATGRTGCRRANDVCRWTAAVGVDVLHLFGAEPFVSGDGSVGSGER